MATTVKPAKATASNIITTVAAFLGALKDSVAPERKTSIPVLNMARVTDQTISVTDLDVASTVDFKGTGKGDFLIPYSRVMDMLSGEDGALTLQHIPASSDKDSAGHVKLTLEDCEYTVPTMSVKNFPNLPSAAPFTFAVDADALATLIKSVSFAISGQESRYTLNGALMQLRGNELTLAATDGHRLAMGTCAVEGTLERPVMIPRKALAAVSSKLTGKIGIGADDHTIFFRDDTKLISSRKMSGQFPNYESVLVRDPLVTVNVPNSDLLAIAVRRAAKCADERSGGVRLSFGPTDIEVHGESIERGTATSRVPATSGIRAPHVFRTGFNAGYLLDVLKVADGDAITIELTEEQKAMQIRFGNLTNIIMPLRL